MSTSTEETSPGLEPAQSIDHRASKGGFYTPQEGVSVGKFKDHPAYRTDEYHLAEVRKALTPGPITDLILECHGSAWRAKWWHDLRTGQPIERNAGEMMLLQCSELGEAADGVESNLKDDKLPHRMMVEVELADFEIRLYDYCGGLKLDLQAAVLWSEENEALFGVVIHDINSPALWHACRHILRAMEAYRKSRIGEHIQCLARAYRVVRWYAKATALDVDAARVEKMAFNKVRKDHKVESRLADDGKKF